MRPTGSYNVAMESAWPSTDDEGLNDHEPISSLLAITLPWAFTQHHPLGTADFIRAAKERGVELTERMLRQLYRQRVLIPMVAVTNRRHAEPYTTPNVESQSMGTRLFELREAREAGKVRDLYAEPFQPRLQFTPPRPYNHGWWNGLIYSHHQLTIIPRLPRYLGRARYTYRDHELHPRLPEPDMFLQHRARWYYRIALMATALEARYLPVLDPEWVQLVNAEKAEYDIYRRAFDVVAMSRYLRYSPAQARKDAEELLLFAHHIEPTEHSWSQLIRRAPRDSWKHLKDASLSAMDLRETAEILLRFYEDLSEHGAAEPLPTLSGRGWHPLLERLSHRPETLDQDLMHLGLSPHPRVVLALEGESEELHAPRVWRKLGFPAAPELVRTIKLGGVNHDPVKVAALAATPLVTRQDPSGEFWWVTKPPTRFMVAADPEGPYGPDKIDETRELILAEIRSGLAAQGAKTTEEELGELVELRTWDASCYEYAHFTDEELADGIAAIHTTCNGWTRDQLVEALGYWRDKDKDIKRVWESGRWDDGLNRPSGAWAYKVSKTKLAEVLWPALEAKIEAAMTNPDAPLPPIARAIDDAFSTAQRWRYKSFVLRAA